MNDKMYERLLELAHKREMVSIFSDKENTDEFSIGYISTIDNENVIIQHVAPSGFNDGYILRKTKSIYRIEEDGLYKNKILKLCDAHNTKVQDVTFMGWNLTVSLLQFAFENNYIVSIETNNSGSKDAQGFVIKTDEDNVVIALVTEYGVYDGIANIDISAINRIDCDTDIEQMLKILAGNRSI